jgi:hypothetical protein
MQSAESRSKGQAQLPSAGGEENPTSADLPTWSSGPKVDRENIKLRKVDYENIKLRFT